MKTSIDHTDCHFDCPTSRRNNNQFWNTNITQAFWWVADSTICWTCCRLVTLSLVAHIWPIATIFSILIFSIWLENCRLRWGSTLLVIVFVYWLAKKCRFVIRTKCLIISSDIWMIPVCWFLFFHHNHNHNQNINNQTANMIKVIVRQLLDEKLKISQKFCRFFSKFTQSSEWIK